MKSWVNEDVKKEIRKVFEPRYHRKLSEKEVIEIANNLAGFVEVYAKSKYGSNTK